MVSSISHSITCFCRSVKSKHYITMVHDTRSIGWHSWQLDILVHDNTSSHATMTLHSLERRTWSHPLHVCADCILSMYSSGTRILACRRCKHRSHFRSRVSNSFMTCYTGDINALALQADDVYHQGDHTCEWIWMKTADDQCIGQITCCASRSH